MNPKVKDLLGRPLVPFFGDIIHNDEEFLINDTGNNILVRKFNKDGNFEDPIIIPTKYKDNYTSNSNSKENKNIDDYENNFNVDENVEKYAISS